MDKIDKITVDMLTQDGVSILTQKTVIVDGQTYILGNHRRAYSNSAIDRAALATEQPADVVAAIMAIWGDTPTVTEQNPDGGEHEQL